MKENKTKVLQKVVIILNIFSMPNRKKFVCAAWRKKFQADTFIFVRNFDVY